jgi:hypothetical protein
MPPRCRCRGWYSGAGHPPMCPPIDAVMTVSGVAAQWNPRRPPRRNEAVRRNNSHDELLYDKGSAQPTQCDQPRKIGCLFPRLSAGRTSTATVSGFRLRTTQPCRDRAGTTLKRDTDEVYRWYSLCSSPPRSRDARGRRVATHTGRTSGRDDRTGTPLVRASALHDVSATESLAAEATWAQPLIREELS